MRNLVIISAGLAVGACAFVVFTLTRSRPEVPAADARVVPPVVREAPRAAPPASTAAPAPSVGARRPAAPKAEPLPAAPVPVATPDAGTLRIDADVPGSQVFIDRNFLGVTPMTAENVTPGSHQLNVSAPGYEGVSEPIEVAPGSRDITIKLKEVRLKASISVVHKHRFGSCSGQLVATPQGLRYETADKDDAFSSTLLDIEKFEVDYLAKNLRVQLKKGKRYDFTDPEGNADHLFVFHRDVEKAVERLRKGDPPAVN